ncbi:hypothetical protein A9320_27540 [Ruegeria sp. PBVC088]|nr:hypothetical protein A9320_27540 [Ruegeria sp. PBVC088]
MRTALFFISIAVAGFPAAAERNLVLSLESASDVCSNRPAEPEWMRNIAVRQAYKRVLVQDIYRTQNLERVVETGSCSCDTRFPAWEAAETEFRERFDSAERWEMLEASDTYNRRANALRPDAVTICKAEGNW